MTYNGCEVEARPCQQITNVPHFCKGRDMRCKSLQKVTTNKAKCTLCCLHRTNMTMVVEEWG